MAEKSNTAKAGARMELMSRDAIEIFFKKTDERHEETRKIINKLCNQIEDLAKSVDDLKREQENSKNIKNIVTSKEFVFLAIIALALITGKDLTYLINLFS